jgi:hypothetical protein
MNETIINGGNAFKAAAGLQQSPHSSHRTIMEAAYHIGVCNYTWINTTSKIGLMRIELTPKNVFMGSGQVWSIG